MATLKASSAGFKGSDLSELIRIEPASTALCLLKAAGEADEGKKSRVSDIITNEKLHTDTWQIRAALQFLAARAPSVDGNQKKGNPIGAFLELHVLGLVTRISEVVNDNRDEHSIKQKERFLKALEELVKVAKSHARVARPQVWIRDPRLQDHHLLRIDVRLLAISICSERTSNICLLGLGHDAH
jgi:serine/threonine-protein kinase ATR